MKRFLLLACVLAIAVSLQKVGLRKVRMDQSRSVILNHKSKHFSLFKPRRAGSRKITLLDVLNKRPNSTLGNHVLLRGGQRGKWGRRRSFRRFVRRTVRRAVRSVTRVARSVARISRSVASSAAGGITKAANTVSKKVVSAAKGVAKGVVNAAKETAQFTQDAWDEVADFTQEAIARMEEFANSVWNFFKGLLCDLTHEDILDIAQSMYSLNPDTFAQITDPNNYKNFASGARTLAQATCVAVWTAVEVSNAALNAMTAFIGKIVDKCNLLSGVNPILTIGAGVSASVSDARSIEASAEFGIAMDSTANKYCYVGGCLSQGVTFPPIPSASVDTGVAVSLFLDPSSVPGSCKGIEFSGAFTLPSPLSVGIEISFTYLYAGGILDFLGVSASGEIKASDKVSVSAGVAFMDCLTPVCMSNKGCDCDDPDCIAGGGTSVDQADTSGAECATENNYCTCKGTIYYGANNKYNTKVVNGASTTQCSNSVFGDPIPGVVKKCTCVGVEDDLGIKCAEENGTCECTGSVSYGSSGYWNQKTVVGSIGCTNGNFGDPLVGTYKACFCYPMGDRCAGENGTCNCDGTVTYGANFKYATKKISGSTSCSNGVFGDPIPGTVKSCYCLPEN